MSVRQTDSPSSLATFRNCPRNYFLTYAEGHRDRDFSSIEAVMGTSVHNALDWYYTKATKKGGRKNAPSAGDVAVRAQENFIDQMTRLEVVHPNPGKDWHWGTTSINACVKAWSQFHLAEVNGWRSLRSERKLSFPDGSVGGIADLVYERNGELIVLDWKCGALPWPQFEGSSVERQMGIYAAALHLNGETRPVRGLAVFLAKREYFERAFTPEDSAKLAEWAAEERAAIAAEVAWPKKPGKLCSWCSHYHRKRCEGDTE